MSVGMRQLHRAACVHSRQVVTIATRVIPHQRWFFDLLDITDHYYLTRSRSSQPVRVHCKLYIYIVLFLNFLNF